jgi:pimeloyl-ACP methyl ester carboxylesterase
MKYPSRDTRAKLIRILAIFSFVYLLAIGLLVIGESSMVYRPVDGPSNPTDTGLEHYHLKLLAIVKQSPVVYWENDAPADAPTVVYFHGNGGGLFLHKRALEFFDTAHLHIIAMEYPGYPGDPGDPSESLIVSQATALYDAVSKDAKRPPSIWGYSLGTGVAVQVAAKRVPSALVLEAPFMGVDSRAQEMFPYAPIEQLMKNQYRSRDYIGKVHAPLLILHGTADQIVPIHHGRDLFALANEPKTFKSYDGYGHLNLSKSGAYQDADAFIREHDSDMTKTTR